MAPISNNNLNPNLPPEEIEKLIKEHPEYKDLILRIYNNQSLNGQSFKSGTPSTTASSPATQSNFSSSLINNNFYSGNTSTGASSPIGRGYSNSGSGSCFIATAIYDSPFQKNVLILKQLRDEHLIKFSAGRIFISYYYKYSPSFASFLKKKPFLKRMMRILFYPIVLASKFYLNLYRNNY
jgi:hypothetical protein